MNEALLSSKTGEWSTPQDFFDRLDWKYHFTLDAAATAENAKCARFFTAEDDGLTKNWGGQIVFCNPPTVPHGIVIISDEKHGTWAIDGELAWPTLLQKRGRDACLWENRIIYWMPLPKLPKENAYGPEE